MLLTEWLNPQIVLITATIANKMGTQTRLTIHPASKEMIQMNIYVTITISNKSVQDSSHLAPINTLAPEWLSYVANHCTISTRSNTQKYSPDPYGVKNSRKTLKVSAGVKIPCTALV